MKRDGDERILDASLEEVLGGNTPPDLSARIMCSYKEAQSASSQSLEESAGAVLGQPGGNGAASPPAPPLLGGVADAVSAAPPPVQNGSVPPVVAPAARRSSKRPRRSVLGGIAATLLIVSAGVAIGALALKYSGGGVSQPNLAEKRPSDRSNSAPRSPRQGPPEAPASAVANGASRSPSDQVAVAPNGPADVPPDPFSVDRQNANSQQTAAAQHQQAEPLADDEIVRLVNAELRRVWEQNEVSPAVAATDAEWARRAYLRLLGRIPSVEELRSFTESKAADKREQLVDTLLTDSRYADEYASYWGAYWSNVLIGRLGGLRDGDPASRAGLAEYLRESFSENKAYDQLAYELLTAEGAAEPGKVGFNGAVNFLLSGWNEKATLATARVSRVFLGRQVQCVQCHDHPTNEWKQHDFWQMNAFFRQMRMEGDPRRGVMRLVDRDFAGEGRGSQDGESYFERLNGQVAVVYPRFPDGSKAPAEGAVDDVDRRELLARWIQSSSDLPRAAVNRIWAHFLGFGFTRQVDDLGPHNRPSHPEVLDRLAGQFAAHEYDLKKLLTWIALSEPFGLSSRTPDGALADAPDTGSAPLFSRYYARQMSPEEVFKSLQLAAASAGEVRTFDSAQVDFLSQFVRDMQTDDGNEESTFNGSIRQSLNLMTGPEMQRATSIEQGGLLSQVALSKMSRQEKVEHLFLAAVARPPNTRELRAVDDLVRAHQGDLTKALQDIWWALLNSNEFILDH